MKLRIISIILCFVMVVVAFSGCEKTKPDVNNTTTTADNGLFGNGESTTNSQSSGEQITNSSGIINPTTPNSSSSDEITNANVDSTKEASGNESDTQSDFSEEVNQRPDGTNQSSSGASQDSDEINQNADDETTPSFNGETDTPNNITNTRDSRLIGVWNASSEIPVNKNGTTVIANCSIAFREDGTYEQITTEAQARQMIIDTYLIVFNCRNEQELDRYIRLNKGTTLEGYVVMALAEMTDDDFYIKGTWETKDNNTLYETFTIDGEKHVETATYILSKDRNAIKLDIEDGSGGTTTMILKKA